MTDATNGGAAAASATKPEQAIELTFRDVRFTVKDRHTGQPLDILKGISGTVAPNRLTVIMGSSGAGKTTLLDVLAVNLFGAGVARGEVLVNGAPRDAREFAQVSCYVLQRDVLLSSSTVREAITLAALLKLPRALPRAAKLARVDAILADLDLVGCQHTLVGDEHLGIKGISGGQRRRVSVGIELVKSPRVLFLDEPTSGLDSEMAVSLIDTLSQLAHDNRTVCMTIHQPNSLITSKFDDFLLLHAGASVYVGEWAGAVPWFAARGCVCPQYVNPTDYFMSVLRERGDELAAAWAAHEAASRAALKDVEAGDGGSDSKADGSSPGRSRALRALGSLSFKNLRSATAASSKALELAPSVPWHYQVYLLSGRMMRQWVRNPVMLISEVTQYAFLAVFVGLVWLQVGNSLGSGVNDRASSLWFSMAILSFTPAYTAAVVWDKDRLLLRRESQQGMYSVTAWFAARTLTLLPFEVAQVCVYSLVAYFMVGYVVQAGHFFVYLAVFALFQLTSETVGEMSAVVTGNSTYAVLLLTFVLLFLLSFSGFLVSDVPVYFRWITKISYLTYAYAAVAENEFTSVTFTAASGLQVPGSWLWDPASAPPAAQPLLEQSTLSAVNNGLSVGANLAVLLGITVATRALAFAFIWGLARLKRL